MEAVPQPSGSLGCNLSDAAANLDLLDQLLWGDGWLDFPDCSDILQAGAPTSTSPFNSLSFSPPFEINNSSPNLDQLENCSQYDTRRSVVSTCPSLYETQAEKIDKPQTLNSNSLSQFIYSVRSGDLSTRSPTSKPGTGWWNQPREYNSSVKDRFVQALNYMKQTQRDGDVLVQLWVPVRKGDQLILITYGQPFSLDPNCEKLVNYREVSTNYQFSADENSDRALGLPGRVFLGRLPEWTPDVRFFSSYEYPRVSYAQQLDICGTIALPVFDQGNQSCWGVVEVVMTTRKINYSFELETICNALQVVDLRSSAVASVPHFKVSNDSYEAALPEILEVLKAVCKMHMLPLAQTWIPCIQQGKTGIRHSDENFEDCVSTSDAACYVSDPTMMGFHEACSEHHLLRGQGVAGRAFITNKPCFMSDVTASSKTEYPLSHHAKMLGLRGAVAIRLRSIMTGNADFVLEFFLPTNCILIEEQKLMLDSLSCTVQHVCQTLRVVTAKELEDEATLQVNKVIPSDILLEKSSSEEKSGQKCENVMSFDAHTTGVYENIPTCFTSLTEASQKKSSHVFKFNKHGIEGYGITTDRHHTKAVLAVAKISSKLRQHQQDLAKDISHNENSFNFGNSCIDAAKKKERRRRKTKKTVSLEVLCKYFAGNLKHAAKSIGVCPTTLKKICRQHGITRWPSRIIKKLDHSVRNLQVVIDTVHGVDKAIQFSSPYKDSASTSVSDKNSSGDIPPSKLNQKDHPTANHQELDAELSHSHILSSYLSSCNQTSSSSLSSSSGANQCIQNAEPMMNQEVNKEGKIIEFSHGANGKMDLHLSNLDTQFLLNRSQSQKPLGEHCSLGSLFSSGSDKSSWISIKAMYGAEKVRIQLHPSWGFKDLRQEISKRFNIGITNSVDLRYLDDESEWVLLTCDEDLQECIHIYRSSAAQTIKISVQPVVSLPIRASMCPSGLNS